MQFEGAEQPMITGSKPFTAYAVGVLHASVCTSLAGHDATNQLNLLHPAGVEPGWSLANEPFLTGEPNGHPCYLRPETHRHLLFKI